MVHHGDGMTIGIQKKAATALLMLLMGGLVASGAKAENHALLIGI